MKEIEIEFKNLLTEEQYETLLTSFNVQHKNIIFNDNYYYDSEDNIFKQNNCALRIRHSQTKKEITLKIKGAEQNIEVNVALLNSSVPNKLTFNDLPNAIKETLNDYNIHFEHISKTAIIKTSRYEVKGYDGLIVIDKTTFANDIVDYELEFEVADYKSGLANFNKLLADFNININPAKPKIARAIKYALDNKK